MAKVLDDGMMLTLGVVGVVAAVGAVAGRRGSRDTVYDPQHRQRINKDEIIKTLPAPPHGTAWKVKKLIRRPNMGEYGFELDVGFAEPRKYVAPYIYYSNERGDGWYWSYYFMTRSENTNVPVGNVFRDLTQGHFGSGFTSPSAAAAAMLNDLENRTTNLFDEKSRGSRAMGRHAYVVVNKMSHGSKRLHGPFSSMEEAEKWASAHGETAVVKTVNIVSKTGDGEFMVIEQHSNGEVFHGFFKTASTASRWINRQPDEQTLTDSFVVRVHRAGSAAMHRGSRAREGYQAPLRHSYTVVNKTENGIEVFGPFSDKVEAERVSSIFEADDEVRMSYVGIANVVSAKDGKYAVVAEHDEDGETYEVINGFFSTESAAEKWMNRQPDEQTATDVYVTKVFKPKV